MADGLESVLFEMQNERKDRELSIISVDMGIRNLAYCHLQTKLATSKTGEEILASVKVDTWRRMDVSSGAVQSLQNEPTLSSVSTRKSNGVNDEALEEEVEDEKGAANGPTKESFDPTTYAERAHTFVSRILKDHNPTHILIERQRFRSQGGPAVLEWTLRVGMFEFMLYATLHTLKQRGAYDTQVVPVQPSMVNRYWMSLNGLEAELAEKKTTSAAMKQFKIELVRRILEDEDMVDRSLAFTGQARELAGQFLDKFQRAKRGTRSSRLPKLDDLSDCLLQGLAWIAWQENRNRLQILKSSPKHPNMKVADVEGDPLLPWRLDQK